MAESVSKGTWQSQLHFNGVDWSV